MDLLPWTRRLLQKWSAAESGLLPVGALDELAIRGPIGRRRCAGLVVLDPPNAHGHRAGAVEKAEALLRLALDNVRVAPRGLDARGAQLFDSLARLASVVPGIVLSVGPDPTTLKPSLLEAAWRSARASPAAPA